MERWRRELAGAVRSEFLRRHPYIFLLWAPRVTPSSVAQLLNFHTVANVSHARGQAPPSSGPPDDALLIPVCPADLGSFADAISIGRGANCDIVLNDASVSKLHGHFRNVTLESAEFTDARSVNGTRVEGLLIPSGSSVVVRPRSFLSFGRVRAQVLSPVDVYDLL